MREDKTKLTPVAVPKATPATDTEKLAREELRRERARTAEYKRRYFDFYDDVKISHREDW